MNFRDESRRRDQLPTSLFELRGEDTYSVPGTFDLESVAFCFYIIDVLIYEVAPFSVQVQVNRFGKYEQEMVIVPLFEEFYTP